MRASLEGACMDPDACYGHSGHCPTAEPRGLRTHVSKDQAPCLTHCERGFLQQAMDLTLDAVLSALFGSFLIVLKHCGERVSFMGCVDLSVTLLGSGSDCTLVRHP